MSDFHFQSVDETVETLHTNLQRGLRDGDVELKRKKYGLNELDKEEEKSLWERIKEQFEDTLVQILLAAATISFIIAITGK